MILTSEPALRALLFGARVLLALLVTVYFHMSLDALPGWQALLFVTGLLLYLLAQLALLLKPVRGAALLSSGLDYLATLVLLWQDPSGSLPLVALFFLVSILASIQLTLAQYLISLLVAMVTVVALVWVRWQGGVADFDPAALVLAALLLASLLLHGLLLYRHHVVRRLHQDALWRDQETGLVTLGALSHVGGWLLPLHERLSSPLTALMLRPQHGDQLVSLALAMGSRLRRSDVCARIDERHLMVLLPDTSVSQAEQVVSALRDLAPSFLAVITPVPAQTSIDLVVSHLTQTLERGILQDKTALLHAPPLRRS